MNINMKDVELVLEDGWVCIKDKTTKETTKLLYGTEKSLADIEEDFDNMSNDNLVTAAEDYIAKLSFADDVFEAITGIRDATF